MLNQPNILVLHSDEHSYRFLSHRSRENGGEPCQTPTLDRLAKQAITFDKAYCQFPLCSPSRIAMLTGRHAHRCGAWTNESILSPELPTWGSHFQSNGYQTATVGKMHLGGSLQHAGFSARPYGDFGGMCSHQYDPLSRHNSQNFAGMTMRSRTADAGLSEIPESLLQENMIIRESMSWLRENHHTSADRPWLLYTSFSRPHFPLTAPRRYLERYYDFQTNQPTLVTRPRIGRSGDTINHPMTLGAIKGFQTEAISPEEEMKARAAYFASVDFLDEMLGDFLVLLEHSGFLDNTVIIYTSDHGELCGEHGLWWKNTWHEASTRVPFIISLPNHRKGTLSSQTIQNPVSLADIFPTICGLSNIESPDGLDGVDLSPVITGQQQSPRQLIQRSGAITESLTPRWGLGTEFRMIRSERYKYVAFRGNDDLAFDLVEDPDEQHNLLLKEQIPDELIQLRSDVLEDFDFDRVEAIRHQDSRLLATRYRKRVNPTTPNQILLRDGRLVEADSPLFHPEVVSNKFDLDFDDSPGV